MQEYVDEAKVKATWIWEELNKEPADATETEKVYVISKFSHFNF